MRERLGSPEARMKRKRRRRKIRSAGGISPAFSRVGRRKDCAPASDSNNARLAFGSKGSRTRAHRVTNEMSGSQAPRPTLRGNVHLIHRYIYARHDE